MPSVVPPAFPERDRVLQVSARIAERLTHDAIWEKDTCTWLVVVPGRDVDSQIGWRYEAARSSLYQGTVGIGLFLMELWAVSREANLLRTALGALRHALRDGVETACAQPGFYSGGAGLAYACARMAELTASEEWSDQARVVVERLARTVSRESALDLIGGAAGAVVGLLRVHETLGMEAAKEAATAYGRLAADRAVRRPSGWSWPTRGLITRQDLCGYAHGAAGFAHAFLELFSRTSEPDWAHAASRAMQYERRKGGPRPGTWWDFRVAELASERAGPQTFESLVASPARLEAVLKSKPTFASLWCHGAPGIVLSRLRALTLGIDRDECERDVRSALSVTEETVRNPTLASHCLCHGVFGNAETLRIAQLLGDGDYQALLTEVALKGIDSNGTGSQPWPSGGPGRTPDPSLMLGDAGIGYFLLSLAEESVPSLLFPTSWRPSRTERATVARGQQESLRIGESRRAFPLFTSVLSRLDGARTVAASIDRHLAEARTLEEAMPLVVSAIDRHEDKELRTKLLDALGPELALQRAEMTFDDYVIQLLEEASVDRVRPVDWNADRFVISRHTRVLRTSWGWRSWVSGAANSPDEAPEFSVVCRQGSAVRLFPVTRLVGFVFEAIVTPLPVGEIVDVLDGALQADAASGSGWIPHVKSVLSQGIAGGIVRVTRTSREA